MPVTITIRNVPDDVRKLNGVLRYSQGTATDGFTLSAMAYSNGWNSTDQVAQRAIDQGVIGRFGSLDPTDGGISSRVSLSAGRACQRICAQRHTCQKPAM